MAAAVGDRWSGRRPAIVSGGNLQGRFNPSEAALDDGGKVL